MDLQYYDCEAICVYLLVPLARCYSFSLAAGFLLSVTHYFANVGKLLLIIDGLLPVDKKVYPGAALVPAVRIEIIDADHFPDFIHKISIIE